MAVVLDTGSSVPDRRLAVWQDIVCDVFVGLDCHSDMREAFWGAVSQSAIGPAAFTRVDSCAQRVFRTPSRIARASGTAGSEPGSNPVRANSLPGAATGADLVTN